MGTDHTCDHVINETGTIDSCPNNCKVCQAEVDKREYYECRWQKNEDGYTGYGMCRENLGYWVICVVCFVQDVKKRKRDIQVVRIAQSLGAQDVMTKG